MQDFSKDEVHQFWAVLNFIQAMSHAAAELFSVCWKPDNYSEEANNNVDKES